MKKVYFDNNIYNYFLDKPKDYNKMDIINAIKNNKIRIICSEVLIGEIAATIKRNESKAVEMLNILNEFNPKVIKAYPLLMDRELERQIGSNIDKDIYYDDKGNSVLKRMIKDTRMLIEFSESIQKNILIGEQRLGNVKNEFKDNLNKIKNLKKSDYLNLLKETEENKTLNDPIFKEIKRKIIERKIKLRKNKINKKVAAIRRAIINDKQSPIRKYGTILVFGEVFYFLALNNEEKDIIRQSLYNDIHHVYYATWCDYYVTDNDKDRHLKPVLESQSNTKWIDYEVFIKNI